MPVVRISGIIGTNVVRISGVIGTTVVQIASVLNKSLMAKPLKFVAILNSGYFRFLSISDSGEELELLFSAELKTNCFSLNMVYKMYLSYNVE